MHVPNCRPLFKSIVFCLRLLSLLLFLKNTLHIPGNFSEQSVFLSYQGIKLVLFVCFVDRCLCFWPFSFDQCVVCRFADLITSLVSSNSS